MSKKAEALKTKFGANISKAVAIRPGATPEEAAPAADKYAGVVKARTFADMPVDAILADPQAREEFDPEDLRRLAGSIRRFGQLAPIRVRRDEGRGAWVVLVGERRLRACKLAGLERVRVELVEREMTEADILAEQVVENAVRADLKPVEAGRAYRRLMDLNGWGVEELAESLGIEPTGVHRCLGLLRLPDDIAARVDAGEILPTAAYEISKLQFADDQRAVAEKVVAKGLDHKGTVEEVRRRKEARRSPKGRGASTSKGRGRKVTERTFRTSGGCRVTIERGRGLDGAVILAALREAVALIEAEVGQGGRGEAA